MQNFISFRQLAPVNELDVHLPDSTEIIDVIDRIGKINDHFMMNGRVIFFSIFVYGDVSNTTK